jgi:hypothetical protein
MNPGNKMNVVARPTQLQKALHVAEKFGNPASGAQFTERAIYDSLPLDGRTTFRFFENCSSRRFPLTNLSENKLQTQENLVVKYVSLEVATYTDATYTECTDIAPLSTNYNGLYRSDISLQIAQSQVLKPFPLDGINPNFNATAQHSTSNIVKLGTDLTIPQLLEFVCQLQTTTYTPTSEFEVLVLKLSGQATIFSPRASF